MSTTEITAAESVLRSITEEQEAELVAADRLEGHADDRVAVLRARRILLDRAKHSHPTDPHVRFGVNLEAAEFLAEPVKATPRTDEILRRNACSENGPKEDYEALALHAEQLERELAAANEYSKNVEIELDQLRAASIPLADVRGLVEALEHVKSKIGPWKDESSCDCEDCEMLRPVNSALTAFLARHPATKP